MWFQPKINVIFTLTRNELLNDTNILDVCGVDVISPSEQQECVNSTKLHASIIKIYSICKKALQTANISNNFHSKPAFRCITTHLKDTTLFLCLKYQLESDASQKIQIKTDRSVQANKELCLFC